MNQSVWPWKKFGENIFTGEDWPNLSIIIPSYNQGCFLEETLLSVINQDYPNLEIILIDGGSTDDTMSIIKKYERHLTYWVSEKDKGQSDAINKGFERATGKYITWINSDDCYLEKYFYDLFSKINGKSFDFIYGNKGFIGENFSDLKEYNVRKVVPLKLSNLLRFFSNVDYIIPSQSVFISSQTLNKIGFLKEELHYCMDLELFCRIANSNPHYYVYQERSFFYRTGSHTKTQKAQDKMLNESLEVAKEYSIYLSWFERLALKYEMNYVQQFKKLNTNSFIDLIMIITLFPLHSIKERRLLGLLKSRFLSIFGDKVN